MERKLGIFCTRGGVLAIMALIGGIIETPWLRWFVLVSVAGGALFALVLHFFSVKPESLSIIKPKV